MGCRCPRQGWGIRARTRWPCAGQVVPTPWSFTGRRGRRDSAILNLDRYFGIREQGSTYTREIRAGFTTFLTMSYILTVNPQILGHAIKLPDGGDATAQLIFATAAASAIGSIVMGIVARYPFATAPGMGLNAYFAFTVVGQMGIPWQVALGAVFVEGLIFMALSFGGVRQAILSGIPGNLKYATTAGIGLFLALIGLKNAGIVVADPATYVRLGHLGSAPALIALVGLVITAIMLVRKISGAILLGIVSATLLAVFTGAHVYSTGPTTMGAFAGLGGSPVRMPVWPTDLFMAMDVKGALGLGVLGIVFTFLFVEIFDTAGTLIGLATEAGFVDEKGNLPRANEAFVSDAVATTLGAVVGTSTTTAYIESAAGIAEGGRTGLTAVVVGLLFMVSTFFWPLLQAIPNAATAPALVLVGAMMLTHLRRVEWTDYTETIPVFLTMSMMPFTYSIANGVSFGIISYCLLKLLGGRWREVHWVSWFLALILLARYVFLSE